KRRATTSGARVRRRLQSLSARADSGSTGVTLLSMNSSLKEQHSAMADPAPQGSVRVRATEFVLFAFVALLVGFMASSASGIEPADRDLIDTDGYMRYLRVEQLLENGDWFDSSSPRSNYPFGESQHWTRVLDVYIVAPTFLLQPFLGSDALYWASFVNAPQLLVVA